MIYGQNEYLKVTKHAFSIIEKMKSSINNKYCLYCKNEIVEENHFCSELELIGDKIVSYYFQLESNNRKEILEQLNDPIIKNQEFAENIKNKILAYSI